MCGESEMSSEVERKEKKDDHENKLERDNGEEDRIKQVCLSKVLYYSNYIIPTYFLVALTLF